MNFVKYFNQAISLIGITDAVIDFNVEIHRITKSNFNIILWKLIKT